MHGGFDVSNTRRLTIGTHRRFNMNTGDWSISSSNLTESTLRDTINFLLIIPILFSEDSFGTASLIESQRLNDRKGTTLLRVRETLVHTVC